jgi:hypothetical protein
MAGQFFKEDHSAVDTRQRRPGERRDPRPLIGTVEYSPLHFWV